MNKISSLFGRRGFGTKWGQLVVPIPDTKKVSNLHKAIKIFWLLHPPPVALSLKLPGSVQYAITASSHVVVILKYFLQNTIFVWNRQI